nr:hypothetical protein [Tanacetum cinerariifolium]
MISASRLTPPAPQDEDEHELIQPHDPDFIPEPIYPKYIPLEDEHILAAEEQPLPPVVSPTAESLGYVDELDLEEDPKEYEEDETKDGPVGYPMDGGDDGDNDDIDSLGYDADNKDEDEEEEEYLSPIDSATLMSLLPHLREHSPSYHHPPLTRLPLEIGLLSDHRILFPFHQRQRYEVGKSFTRGQGVDYGFADTVEAEMRHRGIREVGYRIKDTWIDPAEAVLKIASTTLEKVNTRVTEPAELHELDTQDLYALLEDAQDNRTRISQRVAIDSQRVDILMGDRMTLQETV